MPRTMPPFRADMVGSLLRTAPVKEARVKRAASDIDAAALKAVEDAEIARIVKRQEEVGLQSATDGEFRRAWWHFDFLEGLDGVQGYDADQGIQFQGVQTKSRSVKVTGKLSFSADHPMLDHFRFLRETTTLVPKMTIPSPSVLHFRGGRKGIATDAYPDMDDFFNDLGATYRAAVQAFYDAGCRYLQLDDTVWAYLCSEEQRQQARDRGEDVDALPALYARTINQAVAGRPDDMRITMHICRGNFRSTWISEGGYEPVAETLFGSLNIDGFFLEYDTERAGGFEPLRFVQPGEQQIVLGLVTSKTGTLEKPDDIKTRIDEATRFVALDQLCLSPQCGFASTEEGNVLAEEEQWAKLKMIVDIAHDVWR